MPESSANTEQEDHPQREVRYEHSREFPSILEEVGCSLLVSTYQAGKLVVIGTHASQLTLSFHNFTQAMGIAVHQQQIAIGGRNQVWYLRNTPSISGRADPAGTRDACYLARTAHITEEIHGHEMAWCRDQLWLVNTRFSCLCTLDRDHSFVPRWKPSFISELSPDDRCHLNGLAIDGGRPRFVTAHSETNTPAGWRPVKVSSGCVIDVTSGQTIARGFAMPHSPRVYGERLWVLDSGKGHLVVIEPATGRGQVVSRQPGFTRGLGFAGPYAFLGLSKIRETSTFGGVPIAEDRDKLKAGVGVIDLRTGRMAAHFEFMSGVDEIFDVQILRGVRNPYVSGPYSQADGHEPIWIVPESARQALVRGAGLDMAPRSTD